MRNHNSNFKPIVTCLFQLYSAVWCFLRNGDVFAHQDAQPFLKLGVTKALTDNDPVVQVKSSQGNQLVLATKNGGVYLAALSDSGQFQLRIVEVKFGLFRTDLKHTYLDPDGTNFITYFTD